MRKNLGYKFDLYLEQILLVSYFSGFQGKTYIVRKKGAENSWRNWWEKIDGSVEWGQYGIAS